MSHFARQEDNRTNPVRRSYPNGLLLSFSSSSSSSLSFVSFVQWVTWDTNAVQFLSRINEEVISRSTLLPKTPVTIKTNIKRDNLVLDKRSLTAYFNGLVLPHLDYTDIVWGDQTGLTTRMKQLQSFQNRFVIKIVKAKVKTDESLTLARWASLHARRFGRLCCFVQDVLKGVIPEKPRCVKFYNEPTARLQHPKLLHAQSEQAENGVRQKQDIL